MTKLVASYALAFAVCAFSGCSARPAKPPVDSRAASVLESPAESTQQAARAALVVLGFEIKKADPLYVEGFRPHKVGAFVGSGGETAGVWLESVDPARTRVLVDTAKSVVGMAGQKDWDDEILAEMRKALRQP